MEMAMELMKAKFEGQAQMSMQNLCGLISHHNEEIRKTVRFALSESLYCYLKKNTDAPELLAEVLKGFVWEALERGEWDEQERAKFMESMNKANSIIEEINVHLPEKMANWHSWDEEEESN